MSNAKSVKDHVDKMELLPPCLTQDKHIWSVNKESQNTGQKTASFMYKELYIL